MRIVFNPASVEARFAGKSTADFVKKEIPRTRYKVGVSIPSRKKPETLAFPEKSAIIRADIICPERWQSGRMRSIANAVIGSNRSAGSNPALSAFSQAAFRNVLKIQQLRKAVRR